MYMPYSFSIHGVRLPLLPAQKNEDDNNIGSISLLLFFLVLGDPGISQ